MDFSAVMLPVFLVAGCLAGFLNTVAGGGSMVTFPLLILAGFPAHVANGTIRVTILLQNLVAVPGYARHGFFFPRQALALGVVAVPAALVGARTAVHLDPDPYRRVSAVLLVVVLATLFVKPAAWMREKPLARIRWGAVLPLIALVGFYGGFFQLGVGLPFLAVTVLAGGWDLVSANAVKVTVILLYIGVSLLVFASHGHVDWVAGLALGIGNMAGAWIGARSAVRKGPGWIRWILVGMGILAATKLLMS